jgi:excisionase family DNA binding protein
MENVDNDPRLSVRQSAEYLGVAVSTIHAYLWKRTLKRTKIGRRTFVRLSQLNGLIKDES